jgi:PKHD-type hydroxylase
MLVQIPDVLTGDQVDEVRRQLADAEWADASLSVGSHWDRARENTQLREDHPVARSVGEMILVALQANPLFISAALPERVFPPLFYRYETGQAFGNHADNAIRVSGSGVRIRTDLSCTLFLSHPHEYDDGELVIEDTYGVHTVKLAAGDLVLHPAADVCHVRPVTRGVRLASSFWLQSMVRDTARRMLLFDLDTAIQRLSVDVPDHVSLAQFTAVYHNLLRQWADV